MLYQNLLINSFKMMRILMFSATVMFACILFSCSQPVYVSDPDYEDVYEGVITENSNKTDAHAFSGKYSVALNAENPFGLSIEIKGVQIGDVYHATLFRKKGNPHLKLAAGGNHIEYRDEAHVFETSGDWEAIQMLVKITTARRDNNLKFFAYHTGGPESFADSLVVNKLKQNPTPAPLFAYLPVLHDIINNYALHYFKQPDLTILNEYLKHENVQKILRSYT